MNHVLPYWNAMSLEKKQSLLEVFIGILRSQSFPPFFEDHRALIKLFVRKGFCYVISTAETRLCYKAMDVVKIDFNWIYILRVLKLTDLTKWPPMASLKEILTRRPVSATIKLTVPAGAARPAPPVGPALGQYRLNLMAFCKDFNARTQKYKPDTPMGVKITAFKDNTFEFTVKSPSVTWYLKKAAVHVFGVNLEVDYRHCQQYGNQEFSECKRISYLHAPEEFEGPFRESRQSSEYKAKIPPLPLSTAPRTTIIYLQRIGEMLKSPTTTPKLDRLETGGHGSFTRV
ncbi:hypothetical protein IFM89_031783 [Coptis chinensis]|uniref:Large ribosomal subunit protein uL11m n=1 Tax=Coptis chinensis TaxID=261450 RepID=A0A835IW66_9MAGN|nr:hypothetical protein IFM89_031783 [Coptis chinensis]